MLTQTDIDNFSRWLGDHRSWIEENDSRTAHASLWEATCEAMGNLYVRPDVFKTKRSFNAWQAMTSCCMGIMLELTMDAWGADFEVGLFVSEDGARCSVMCEAGEAWSSDFEPSAGVALMKCLHALRDRQERDARDAPLQISSLKPGDHVTFNYGDESVKAVVRGPLRGGYVVALAADDGSVWEVRDPPEPGSETQVRLVESGLRLAAEWCWSPGWRDVSIVILKREEN